MATRPLLVVVCLFAIAIFSRAEEEKKKIKHAPAPVTSPASGREMFVNYCASCHGRDGKGDGPAAAALNKSPAGLTALAKNYGGKYPAMKVASVLEPVWGRMAARRCPFGGLDSGV